MTTHVASALSRATSADDAVKESFEVLTAGVAGEAPVLVIVFASTSQPLQEIAPRLAKRFAAATVLGASTAGEFTERGDAKSSVAALAIAGDYKVFAGMATGLRERPRETVRAAVEGLPRELAG